MPVVDVMSDVVAIVTSRESCHKHRGMRNAVAALAGRDSLVLPGMAGYARQALMPGLARAEQVDGLLMAGRALPVGGVLHEGHHFRHVGLVAFLAIRFGHVDPVRLVALHTERHYPMHLVAV